MSIEDFMQNALPRFENQITDLFFFYVQSDKALMKMYLDTVASTGNLRTVNRQIAQELAKHFSLINTQEEEKNPVSNLIQSYSKLRKEEKQ